MTSSSAVRARDAHSTHPGPEHGGRRPRARRGDLHWT